MWKNDGIIEKPRTFLKRMAFAAVVLDDTALVGEQPAWEITINRRTNAEATV
jgi:hypothetical protein